MRRIATHRILLVLVAMLPGVAPEQSPDENVTYGYAQVLRVTPVYEIYRTHVPEQHCDGQAVRDGGNSNGGMVIGAVVGGALGNQAGKGDGRKAATVAGAVIGGGIGRHVDRNNGSSAAPRCRVVEVEHEERRLAGYDVEYQYRGDKYMSRLPQDPGNRLRVRVSVTPDAPALGIR